MLNMNKITIEVTNLTERDLEPEDVSFICENLEREWRKKPNPTNEIKVTFGDCVVEV